MDKLDSIQKSLDLILASNDLDSLMNNISELTIESIPVFENDK